MKNCQGEGVWRNVSRWIRVGWMRLDLESGLRVRLVEKRGSLKQDGHAKGYPPTEAVGS